MAILKCKMCGGELNLTEGASTAECEYCGSVQTVPKVDDEKKLNLFTRANRLRAACEFDKAAGIYETIIADFPEESEAYWGLVLCKYGIEYVDDPATGKKIPTCHRSAFESVMKDQNVELAQEYADIMARRLYREEAKQIEELRKGIIAVSANEAPYDVFICYKETDFDGKRTLDSVLAQDIYDALTDKDYRVFFSRISLEDKLGTEYEPYIFAALNSAKIMLVIGTDFEYFNAVWVKNEWSRFLKLMAQDKSKHLIPCYKGIDAYDMPEEFARLQAQDLDKMGAIQDIVRGVQKLLPKQEQTVKETVIVQQATGSNPTVDSYLERAFMFLEDGAWDSANEYCEKVLDIEPKNAQAYVGKLMVELKVKNREALKDQAQPFDSSNNYLKAIRFGDDQLQAELTGYHEYIITRNEETRIAEEKRAEVVRKDSIYKDAVGKMGSANISDCEKAIALFRSISGWKDADEQAEACSQKLLQLQEKRNEEIKAKRIAQQAQAAKEKERREATKQRLLAIRQRLPSAQEWISTSNNHTAAITINRTVMVAGKCYRGENAVYDWKNIIAVSVAVWHTVGLKSDGTVVATGYARDHACEVQSWRNITQISAGSSHTVGLRENGTVVATGENDQGQCNVSDWNNIVAITAGASYTMGLKADGTVVATGKIGDVSHWKDIVAIDKKCGLKSDGTVVTLDNQVSNLVAGWRDIVAIAAYKHIVGLKADGTVVAAAYNKSGGWCAVEDWRDIIAIDAGEFHTMGLRADGKVVITKYMGTLAYTDVFDDVSCWRLFQDFENLEQEKMIAQEETQRQIWRLRRQCQHCGGELKGLFSKKCVSCGKPKDY